MIKSMYQCAHEQGQRAEPPHDIVLLRDLRKLLEYHLQQQKCERSALPLTLPTGYDTNLKIT